MSRGRPRRRVKARGGGRRPMESVKQKGLVDKMGWDVTLNKEGELRVYLTSCYIDNIFVDVGLHRAC